MLEWMQACLASPVLFVGDTGQLWGWVLLLEETAGGSPVKSVFHQKMEMKPSRK